MSCRKLAPTLLLFALCPLADAFWGQRAAVHIPGFSRSSSPAVVRQAASRAPLDTIVADRAGQATIQAVAAEPLANAAADDLTEKMTKYVTERGGGKVIRKILIANNGMAATKTIMAIRNWCFTTFGDERAIKFVVMATPEDLAANAEFIRRADSYVEVPGGSNANNYANVGLIVDLCLQEDVDAVMVGWGHASENPRLGDLLKERTEALGKDITFVGPTSQSIRLLGDKIGSTLIAQTAGVSCMPWNGDGLVADLMDDGNIPPDQFDAACIHSLDEALEAAERIGYPVMLKASEGGGGKGIRRADDVEALKAAYPQVLGEVPGSPIFLVTLCTGARHIEVQVVGDKHGNAIALGGRDCSTQRRFQKIFEEGPPIVVPEDKFIIMQQAAVNLCKAVNYASAGTVEYMYIMETGDYYFLELNPRLQVEHPVTEGITGVMLPPTQLHVAMGIPLYNVPEIRAFYNKDPAAIGEFDLKKFKPHSDYDNHVIAARITAENPDEGFKPTSGKIDRINFQSNTKVWGYFSVIADGGVHEFADSQFGHVFASDTSREAARKTLIMALKELFIMGDIRTTVEYLGELLETPEFKDNTLDTAWLDGLIADKSVSVDVPVEAAVINAAVYRGFNFIKEAISEFKGSVEKGQLSILALKELQKIPIEITYEDVKYNFVVSPSSADTMQLTINDQVIEVKTREQADGSLYVAYGSEVHQLYAKEEPLGLRMVLDGVTVLLPTLYDPSELRSDITGKLVRYLVEDGTEVKKGEPYAEAEAMKMLITIKSTEDGVVRHEKQPGSIINQGDLLASLELKDPSKVKKIETFSGSLAYSAGKTEESDSVLQSFNAARASLTAVLAGYPADVEPLVAKFVSALASYLLPLQMVQQAASALGNKLPASLDATLQSIYKDALREHVAGEDSVEAAALVTKLEGALESFIADSFESKRDELRLTLAPVFAVLETYRAGLREHAISQVCSLLTQYLSVESSFVNTDTDQAIAALVKANADSLDTVFNTALAHTQLKTRSSLVISLLRQLAGFPERFAVEPLRELPAELDVVVQLSQLSGAPYKEVALNAAQFGLMKAEKPFDETVAELKAQLAAEGADSTAVSRSVVTNALLALFADEEVGQTAMQVAVKRFYKTYNIKSLETSVSGSTTLTKFEYMIADMASEGAEMPLRSGVLALLPSVASMDSEVDALLEQFTATSEPVNVLHVALAEGVTGGATTVDNLVAQAQQVLTSKAAALKAKGIRLVSLMIPNPPKWPRQYSFTLAKDFEEEPARRNLYPTAFNLLEIDRLSNWEPQRLPSISHNSIVLLGSTGIGRAAQQRVFVRGVTHSLDIASEAGAEVAFQKSLDELQLAILDDRVSPTSSSHLFLHMLAPLEGTPEGITDTFKELMSSLIAKYATRLLKLRVDEIEIRAHVQASPDSPRQSMRLVASSMSGQWLKTDGYTEYIDPITGTTTSYCSVGEEEMCFMNPYPVVSTLSNKRAIARRVGTTYAYDFLGLIEKALIKDWEAAIADGSAATMPSDLLSVDELMLDAEGAVVSAKNRVVGENKVGMVAWHATLKTPQYPEGRPLVMIANDCTVQSGSFGVDEDDFFNAMSVYARKGGFPRLHIASNSGARIGLAEELKPFFKVAWNDPSNEALGYKYLYMSEEDAAKFETGKVFDGEWVTEEGEKRFKLDFIVGEKTGLGVENLRGSGLIAGETSRAYDETFTLSYVTGRSVGIGAYINRLAQRVIQMRNGPIILTGFSALNKLLGKEVYVSQDQLGGPQIMSPNGIAHQLADDDQDGVEKILTWLSYVPKTAGEAVTCTPSSDPVDRDITFEPPTTPYDPRHMLAGTTTPDGTFEPGFFDVGSYTEYLADWGKSVVVGRARLGGIPMGVIAVETRLVEQRIPADPANPNSREAVLAQAGQVWYPDSAYKTAQAIQDFNSAENLPLMIFANWRGFSGGTRDMFGEILKFGSYIVDNLRTYKHPVFVYIPPNGELRGGAWVVVDPTINEEMMEMYADTNARGGILEPPGICDVKFRKPDLLKTMHRLDSKLAQLKEQLTAAEESLAEDEADALRAQITKRENSLLPLYTQISHEFADLHDRPGRMLAKGVIRDVVSWKRAREYFYWRVKRRLAQDALIQELKSADKSLSHGAALNLVKEWSGADWEDDKAVLNFLETQTDKVATGVAEVRAAAIKTEVSDLLAGLSDSDKAELLKSL